MDGAAKGAAALAAATGIARHDLVLVLGSGWREALEGLGRQRARMPFSALPGFVPPGVEGHGADVVSVEVDGAAVLVYTGRHHLYESRDVDLVVHPVRVAAAAGCRIAILTSASGGIREDLGAGTLVAVSDHVNLTGVSPLRGPRFVDLTDLYSARLRALVQELEPGLPEAVYAAYWGPNYETPAEIRAYRALGADVVGMSTALEAIAACAAGMEVLALSLVTNRAAGLGGRLDHADVLVAAAASSARAAGVLRAVVRRALR